MNDEEFMNDGEFKSVIEAIFAKLAVRYGAMWLRQWDGVNMDLVKSDWAGELRGYASNPDPLRYALRHLPVDRCPNVAQFKAIANNCPPPELPRLEAPKASEGVIAAHIAKQTGLRDALAQKADGKDWARAILSRVQAGERIRPYSVRSARQALGMEGRMSWQ